MIEFYEAISREHHEMVSKFLKKEDRQERVTIVFFSFTMTSLLRIQHVIRLQLATIFAQYF